MHLESEDAHRAAMSAVPQPERPKKVSVVETNESMIKKQAPPRSIAGFLLTDSSLNPISFNAEAIQILCYPEKLANLARSELFLAEKIRSTLIGRRSSDESPFFTEFRSGRRRYFCRAFLVDSAAKEPFQPSIAILLERGPAGRGPVLGVFPQIKLTQTERER